MAASGDGVQSIDRAVQLITVIADSGADGLRFSDIVAETGLHKTTVHRILATLGNQRWTEQNPETGRYRLGLEFVALGLLGADRDNLIKFAKPHLSHLVELTEDTVYLNVRHGTQSLCIDEMAGSFPKRLLTLGLGDRRPLTSSIGGIALLAWATDEEIAEAIQAGIEDQRHPAADPEVTLATISETRERGYSHQPALSTPGAEGVGVPVFDGEGRAVASISIAAIASRFAAGRLEQIVAWLQEESTLLSWQLHDAAVGPSGGRRPGTAGPARGPHRAPPDGALPGGVR